jgi:hypothetical protein
VEASGCDECEGNAGQACSKDSLKGAMLLRIELIWIPRRIFQRKRLGCRIQRIALTVL